MSKKNYNEALHAMQSGVAQKMAMDPSETSPKHLRVGINSALCDNAALVKLLINKGIITDQEYIDALEEQMNLEVERYEKRLSELLGAKITLV